MTQRIGFIGIGNMGSRMVGNIVKKGTPVLAYDRRAGIASSIGAAEAESIEQVARESDVILFSLPDSKVIEPLVLDGLRPHMNVGSVVIDLSTASPASTQRINAALAEVGVDYLDAGVSGGAPAAAKGTLTLMVGGSADALDRVRELLALISTTVFHMGDSGTGHTAKLLNNFLNAINLSASAEVLVAGRKAGLDVAQLLDVINASSGANWATQNRFPSIVRGDYLEGGLTSGLMMKDILLYVEHLREIGVPTLHAPGPMAAFGVALHTGIGNEISNRVADVFGDLAGGIRLAGHNDGNKKERA